MTLFCISQLAYVYHKCVMWREISDRVKMLRFFPCSKMQQKCNKNALQGGRDIVPYDIVLLLQRQHAIGQVSALARHAEGRFGTVARVARCSGTLAPGQ